ncbi:twin-arginine translocase subunit TatC [Chitinivorax sp. B]|uniref:twin-arginine translocase subunit TatC n=1 Tax=Chitinivorax sp. B TaxID=2502235 RepID=UPI0010F4E6B6|nr:twin-arginine translocase subunit TatC [Chitinivorax sp. B]
MNEEVQSFVSHLVELRNRLLRIFAGIIIVFIALFHWSDQIYALLAMPMLKSLPVGGQMIATDVTTPFFVPMKVTLMSAFLISLPNTLYQIWAFVAPGLYDHEKRMVLPLVVASTLLFLVGMAFAYFLVFPVVFHFMNSVAPEGVAVMTDISKYLDFVLGMFLAFGVTFEVPIAVILLVQFGIISVEKLREARSYVIVGAFVIAAIVTPPDVLSQIMLAVPLWLLYEVGVIVAGMMVKQRSIA